MNTEETYWQAITERNSQLNGLFFYGVKTTQIFCKPDCKSRRPNRGNVVFFANQQDAEKAGFRPCKKCCPDQPSVIPLIETVVHTLCRYIEEEYNRQNFDMRHIAKKAGYSSAHIQKAFKRITGSTPKEYHEFLKQQQLKTELKSAQTLSAAIYAAGYSSPSRVYEKFSNKTGMTPGQYQKKGKGLLLHYAYGQTKLGQILIAATDNGICFLQIGDSADELLSELNREFPKATILPMPSTSATDLAEWMQALNDYLEGKKQLKALPLDIQGTAFQMLVWRYLQTIPAGELRSYTEVAKAIGKPKAARAVASACGRNRIALAIPCHRVIRGSGELAGFRWGLERKKKLIDLENKSS